jgi:cell division protein FtsL
MAKVPVLAFIVCLAMQTPQPLPGQAAGIFGDRSSESKQKAKSAKKNLPSQAVTFRPDNSSPDAKDKKQGLAAEDKEYSVNLASIPPVTVVQPRKDWTDHLLDWGPWVFNLLLVLVGVAAVYVAHWTRVAIEKQVSLMNRQANLMKQQADLMEKQAGIMKRQARISRKQADMQRAEFNQWIVLDGWRTAIPKDNELGISAAFVNKTHFPISKVNGLIRISNQDVPSIQPYVFITEPDLCLLPESPMAMWWNIGITDTQREIAAARLTLPESFLTRTGLAEGESSKGSKGNWNVSGFSELKGSATSDGSALWSRSRPNPATDPAAKTQIRTLPEIHRP